MRRLLPGFLSLVVPAMAAALPPDQTSRGSDDDATLTLTTPNQTIRGDARSRCLVRIEVGSEDVTFSNGDRVFLWVNENDLVGDDRLWTHDFAVTPEEVISGRVDRTLDCSAPFGDDVGDNMEVYAEARVEKDDCSGLCRYDRPSTGSINLAELDDDAAEEDDVSGSARPLALGRTADRIARDHDWFSFELASRARIEFRVEHSVHAGRLDAMLFGQNNEQVALGVDEDDATVVRFEPLDRGTWRLRVSPRDGNDYNFYDARLVIDTLGAECEAGMVDEQPCGNCGMRRRACDANGRWLQPGGCEDEGPCQTGESENARCGNCGTQLTTCNAACRWDEGPCEGEGECMPEGVDEQVCVDEGGVRHRVCDDLCTWGEFGPCEGAECTPGDAGECYEGPDGTLGVGICRRGTKRCRAGTWGECQNQVLPSMENCDDTFDNDCDGFTDLQDDDCDAGAHVGDTCGTPEDCGRLECLSAPSWAVFTGGYCSVTRCDADCPDEALCSREFGTRMCLKRCQNDRDCRTGYRCADVERGRGCLPICNDDSDCRDPALPVCNHTTGRCGTTPDPLPDDRRDGGGVLPVPDAGPRFGDGTPLGAAEPLEGGGCNCDLGARTRAPALAWLLVLLPLGALRRRRRI